MILKKSVTLLILILLTIPLPVSAVGESLTINSPVTFSSLSTITAPKLIDAANSSYFLDPAATDNSLIVAGNVGIGTTSPLAGLQINKANPFSGTSSSTSTPENANLAVLTTNAQAADIGAILGLGGSYGSSVSIFGGFRGGKENSTSDDVSGYLGFYTARNGATFAERMRIDSSGNVGIGAVAPGALLQIGTAGTSTGVIRLTGSTSGYVEISSRAVGGSWKMNLPQGVGTAGYQLTDAAGNGNTSWAAAGSVRSMKNITGLFGDPNDALTTLLNTNVYRFHYKPEMGTGDSLTEYVGVMGDEAPWAVHYNGTVVNPVNTLGYMVLGIQALNNKISALSAPELSNVIKDQQRQINQLKADNDQLKTRLSKVEMMLSASSSR